MTTCNDAKIQDKEGNAWLYSDIVKEHFFHPHNILLNSQDFDLAEYYEGRVGSPACGDEMVIWIKVDPSADAQGKSRIVDCKWQTFGCGSAIASTSILSDMVLENDGMSIDDAMKIKPQDITDRLGGLPARKIHCSVLGDQALQLAIKNWEKDNV